MLLVQIVQGLEIREIAFLLDIFYFLFDIYINMVAVGNAIGQLR